MPNSDGMCHLVSCEVVAIGELSLLTDTVKPLQHANDVIAEPEIKAGTERRALICGDKYG